MLTYAIAHIATTAAGRALGGYLVDKIRAAAAANNEIVSYAVDQKEREEGKFIVIITTVYCFNQAGQVVCTFSNRETKKKPGFLTRRKKKEPGEPDLSWLKDMGDDEKDEK